MRTRTLFVATMMTLGVVLSSVGGPGTAPIAVGFGVSVPYRLPVDWTSSFPYLSFEALLSSHLTCFFDLGTYPASFPDLFEGGAALLAKGWLGPTSLYAGGGLTLQARRVGTAWSFKPLLNLRTGYQIWLLEQLAIVLQFRSLEALPIRWTLAPEVSLGFSIGLGQARPGVPTFEGDYIWLLVGLGVAALIAFLPRK
jgi:hypothetical protein